MSDVSGAGAKISVGNVISRCFAVIRKNLKPFAVIAAVFGAIPQIAIGLLQARVASGQAQDPVSVGIVAGLLGLVAGILAIFAQGALIHGGLEGERGRIASTAELLAAGRRSFFPLIGVSILVSIGVALGFILFLVPGFIAATMWAVATVVVVARPNSGLFFAMEHSAKLTKGNRWRVVGLFLIFIAVVILLYAVAGVVAAAGQFVVSGILQGIVAPVQMVVGIAGLTALYVELDRIKGGLAGANIADTFD